MGIYGDGGLTSAAMTLSNVTANSNTAGGGALLLHYPVFRGCLEGLDCAARWELWPGPASMWLRASRSWRWNVGSVWRGPGDNKADASIMMVRMFVCDGEQVTVVGCSCTYLDTVHR
jgi:hypothetical protein